MTAKRASYSQEFKHQVVAYAINKSQAEAARYFKINKSQISRWVKSQALGMAASTGYNCTVGARKSKSPIIESEDDTVFDSHDELDDIDYSTCPESPDISKPVSVIEEPRFRNTIECIVNGPISGKSRKEEGRENAQRLISIMMLDLNS